MQKGSEASARGIWQAAPVELSRSSSRDAFRVSAFPRYAECVAAIQGLWAGPARRPGTSAESPRVDEPVVAADGCRAELAQPSRQQRSNAGKTPISLRVTLTCCNLWHTISFTRPYRFRLPASLVPTPPMRAAQPSSSKRCSAAVRSARPLYMRRMRQTTSAAPSCGLAACAGMKKASSPAVRSATSREPRPRMSRGSTAASRDIALPLPKRWLPIPRNDDHAIMSQLTALVCAAAQRPGRYGSPRRARRRDQRQSRRRLQTVSVRA